MTLRDELLAEVGPNTHIADLCGRAADELLIKQMKIEQLQRQLNDIRAQKISVHRDLEAAEIKAANYARFSTEWRVRAEAAEKQINTQSGERLITEAARKGGE